MHSSFPLAFLTSTQRGGALIGYIIGALVVGALFLLMLTAVPSRYRKTVVALITFLGGLYFSLEFLLPHEPLKTGAGHNLPGSRAVAGFAQSLSQARPAVADWAIVIGSFALLLGTFNLFSVHGRAIRRKADGWYNSVVFFVAFFTILVVGFLKDNSLGFLGKGLATHVQSFSGNAYIVLFNGLIQSLDATMFSLIAFYIVSAAYRAFRVRSTESALMMATAGIIMLGLVPIGTAITGWLPETGWLASFRLERISYWLLLWPNMAVQRAIEFGLAVGAMAMGLRIWLSLERGSFFDRQL